MITIRLVCYLIYITRLCYAHYIPPESRPNAREVISPGIQPNERIPPKPLYQMDMVLGQMPPPPPDTAIGNGDFMSQNSQLDDFDHSPHRIPPPLPNDMPYNNPDKNGAKKSSNNKDNSNKNNTIPIGNLANGTFPNNDNNTDTQIPLETDPDTNSPKDKKKGPFYDPHFPLDFYDGYDNGSRLRNTNTGSKKYHHARKNDSSLLSNYLINEVLRPYSNYCFANLLSSGYLDLSFNKETGEQIYIKNISLHTPTIVIRCNYTPFNSKTNPANDTISNNLSNSSSQFLLSIALDLEQKMSTRINITKDKSHHKQGNNAKNVIEDHKIKHNHKNKRTSIINNVDHFLFKASFNHSLVMILFLQTTACVGSWMIFLILVLLPSGNRIRSLPVTCYVLLFVIIQTVYMHRTINQVFIPQYRLNIQDVVFYEVNILKTDGYKTCELLIHIACHLNWINIVYYMFHKDTTNNQRRNTIFVQSNKKSTDFYNGNQISKNGSATTTIENLDRGTYSWIPAFTNNRNRFIITVGIILLLLGDIPFGILLWMKNLSGVRGLFKAVECLIYTVFLCSTFGYVWSNFGNVLIRQRVRKKVKLTLRNKIKVLWEDYYQMIPILIYNFVSFVLSYFCTIYFTTKGMHLSRWRFNFVYLLNLLITVNIWGLIAAFEKRELTLIKTTILGRKIDNADPFFFDFKNEASMISTNQSRNSVDFDRSSSNSQLGNSSQTDKKRMNDNKIVKPSKLKHPFSTWKSKINRLKDNRLRSKKVSGNSEYKKNLTICRTSKHSDYRMAAVNDDHTDKTSNCELNLSGKDPNNKATNVQENIKSFSTSYDDRNDSQSVETELTRNVIYYYDRNESTHSDIGPMNHHEHVE
ncbi:hypothetical protein C6P45_003235 [Maudiozyma exigua]|uniref:Uncharacterized protein n=1 Tax=Maudiozyma exigua TaxID=34358 RepID=A0A9P7BB46_MAUEX|nr:hypothetical protein C6P45_003235 [Kazachstania exigua]